MTFPFERRGALALAAGLVLAASGALAQATKPAPPRPRASRACRAGRSARAGQARPDADAGALDQNLRQ